MAKKSKKGVRSQSKARRTRSGSTASPRLGNVGSASAAPDAVQSPVSEPTLRQPVSEQSDSVRRVVPRKPTAVTSSVSQEQIMQELSYVRSDLKRLLLTMIVVLAFMVLAGVIVSYM